MDEDAKFPDQHDQLRKRIWFDDFDAGGVQPCNDIGGIGDGCLGVQFQLDGLWTGPVGGFEMKDIAIPQ